jgi:ATP-dependent Clp protease ATP-binding subunit ClpB
VIEWWSARISVAGEVKDGDRVVVSAEGNVPTCNGKTRNTAEIVQFEAPQPPGKFCTRLFEIRSI